MKTFANHNARDLKQAATLARQNKSAAFVSGGTDLLALVKERIVQPDVLVNLKTIKGLDRITARKGGLEPAMEISLVQ